jgi:xanthosine utilization system XapX-like protein
MTRAELEGYIAQTTRTQRRLGVGLAIGFVAAVIGTIVRVPFAPHAIGLVVIVGLCGFWVTGAHITDWRRRIADLRDPSQAPPVSSHRRYQR